MLKKIIIGLILFFSFFSLVDANNKCKIEKSSGYDKITKLEYDEKKNIFSYIAETNGTKYFIRGKEKNNLGKGKIDKFYQNLEKTSFSYIISEKGKKIIFKDGKKIGTYDAVDYKFNYRIGTKDIYYKATKDKKSKFYKNGIQILKDYSSVDNFCQSSSGKEIAFTVNKGGKSFILKDGKEIGLKYDTAWNPLFSIVGNSFSYIAKKGELKFVVKDGVESEKKYKNSPFLLKYSLYSQNLIYIVSSGIGHLRKDIIVSDGFESKKYDLIDSWVFNPINNEISFRGVIREEKDGIMIKKSILIKNGIEIGKYDDLLFPKYSNDGNSFFYTIKEEGDEILIKDGVKLGEEYLEIWNSGYSSNNKSFSYVAKKKNGKMVLVTDGIEGPEFNEFLYFTYLKDGIDFLYSTKDDNGDKIVVKNNVIIGKGLKPIFSKNGEIGYIYFKNNKNHFAKENCRIVSKQQLFRNYLLIKSKLSKNKQLKKYIPKLNNFIGKVSIFKLKEIKNRLEKFNFENKKYKKVKVLIEYLKAKIALEIYNRENK